MPTIEEIREQMIIFVVPTLTHISLASTKRVHYSHGRPTGNQSRHAAISERSEEGEQNNIDIRTTKRKEAPAVKAPSLLSAPTAFSSSSSTAQLSPYKSTAPKKIEREVF
jgi:hypothetical protein